MKNNQIVLFNILEKRTKSILNGLQERNSDLIRDIRDLLKGISGISDEELESIETVDDLWNILVTKKVISKDELQVLESIAGYVNSKALKKQVKKYQKKNSGMVQKGGRLGTYLKVLKDGTKEAVIILKTVLKTSAQTAAITGTVVCIMNSFHNNPEALQTLFSNILPYGMNLVGLQKGSLYFVLETSSLSSLRQLWTSYKDGTLKEKVKKVINEIDEVRKLTQGTEIDVTIIEIDEEEYREACWVLVLAQIEQAEVDQESSKSVQRPRRHSLSCERDLLPTRDKTRLYWQEWTALKEAEKRLANETKRRIFAEKQAEELRQEMEKKIIYAEEQAEELRQEMQKKIIHAEEQAEELRQWIERNRMYAEKQAEESKAELVKRRLPYEEKQNKKYKIIRQERDTNMIYAMMQAEELEAEVANETKQRTYAGKQVEELECKHVIRETLQPVDILNFYTE